MKRSPLPLILLLLCALSLSASPLFDSKKELASISFSQSLTPQEKAEVEGTRISIILMGPMKPVYSWFGHVAVLVESAGGNGMMYDYGVFDSSKPGFVLDFLKGRMCYSVWETGASWRLENEKEEGRSIVRYELPLTDSQKLGVIRFLRKNAMEGNNQYLYHFYKDNCSTRIRDIIDAATEGEFKKWASLQEGKESTYRKATNPMLSRYPLLCWALNFLQGPSVDTPIGVWEEMFLPQVLGDAVEEYFGAEKEVIAEDTLSVTEGNTLFATVLLPLAVGLLIAYALFLIKERHAWVIAMQAISFILGILSLVLLYGMFLTDLDMIYWNTAIWYINPLLFINCFALSKGNRKVVGNLCKALSVASVLVTLLAAHRYVGTLLLVLPIYLGAWLTAGSQGIVRCPIEESSSRPS